jgi:parallel beta-helix repeat protein
MRNTAWVKAAETPSRTAHANTIRVYCRARLNDVITYDTVQDAVDAGGPGDVVRVAGYCAYVASRDATTQTVYLSQTLAIQGGWNLAFDTRSVISFPTTLDARGEGRVFYLAGNVTPTIEGLRMVNGNATGLGGDVLGRDAGGGVYVIDATPTLSNIQVFSGVAQYGGGLYLERSNATLNDSTVNGNTATTGGGGLYLYYSDAALNENTINDNVGRNGGGLYLRLSDATVSGNTLDNNVAHQYGGGLSLSASGATLNDNTIKDNVAQYGGGLSLDTSDAILISNTVSSNAAEQNGGGLQVALEIQ